MAYSPKGVMDIYEILTRWHGGYTISGTAEARGVDRKTVRRYVRAAEEGGVSRGKPLPERGALLELLLPLVPAREREMPARSQFDAFRDGVGIGLIVVGLVWYGVARRSRVGREQ